MGAEQDDGIVTDWFERTWNRVHASLDVPRCLIASYALFRPDKYLRLRQSYGDVSLRTRHVPAV